MSARPEPRPGILQIEAYVPGKSAAPGGVKIHKLSSNETPLGPSPKAIEAIRAGADSSSSIRTAAPRRLREAIGAKYGLDPARIVCGAGSDELLSLIAHAYRRARRRGRVHRRTAFSSIASRSWPPAARRWWPTEIDYTADVDAILAKVTPRTKIVFLANPNNPTGTYLPFDEVKRLHAGLPPHVLLVLDAAYAEYVRRNDYASGLELVATAENVVMTRTFSKIYGLANLRLGWMVGPAHVIDAVNRIRGPFNVNGPAIAAGIAAIGDEAHVAGAVAHNDEWLPWLTREIEALGLEVTPSVGNFLLVHFPQDGRADREGRGCLPHRARADPAAGRCLRPAAMRCA